MHSIFEFGQDVVIAVLILIGLATALQLSLATSRARSVRLARPGESALKAPALLAAIGVAVYLLGRVIENPTIFPELPTSLLTLLAGAQGIEHVRHIWDFQARRRALERMALRALLNEREN